MKKITFLFLAIFAAALTYAQQQQYVLDFESGNPSGEADAWVSFDPPAPTLQIVTNPSPNGTNTSATTQVMQIDMLQGAPCYAGMTNLRGRLGQWEIDPAIASNLTLSMDVYRSTTAGNVGIKFANANNGTVFEITDNQGAVSAANTWETLTWDLTNFNVAENVNIDQMVVFVDFNCGGTPRTSGVQLLVDNITFTATKVSDPTTCVDGILSGDETGVDCGGSSCAPCNTVAAPTDNAPVPPTRNASDVVSIFSNAYTNIAVDNFDPNWGQSGHTQVNTTYDPGTGDLVLAYPNFNYQGTDFATSPQDLSLMEFVHIDVWTANATALQFSPINDANGGTGAAEFLVNVPLTPNAWSSVDLPITAFTGMTWDNVIQLKFDGQAGTTPADIYLDNIYFYKGTATGGPTAPTTNAPVPPARNASDVISIYGDAYTNIAVDNFDPNWGQSGHTQVNTTYDPGTGDLVMAYPNFNYQGTDFATNPQDASQMQFVHIDVWTANATDLKFSPINSGSGVGEILVSVPLIAGQWSSVDLPIGDFTGMTWDSLIQLKFDGQGGATPSTIYLDNIYFYKGTPLSNDDIDANLFSIYPNPSADFWQIDSADAIIDTIQVFDISGKEVLNLNPGLQNIRLDGVGLTKGMYLARISSAQGTQTVKLIKE